MSPPYRSVFPFVAGLGLCALALLVGLTAEAFTEHRSLKRQIVAHEVSLLLALAAIEAGRERSGTLAELGQFQSRRSFGATISDQRLKSDRPFQAAWNRLAQLNKSAVSGARVRAAYQRLVTERGAFESARTSLDQTLSGQLSPESVEQWIAGTNAYIRALHELRTAITSTQEMLGAVHRPIHEQALVAAEHAGYERALIAYHISSQKTIRGPVLETLYRERAAIELALSTLKHARGRSEVDGQVVGKIKLALLAFDGVYEQMRRNILAEARRGRFPVTGQEWIGRATTTIDSLVAVHDAAHASIGVEIRAQALGNLIQLWGSLAGSVLTFLVSFIALRQLQKANRILYAEKELAEVTLHSIGDAVITTDSECRVEYLNPIAETLTGWTVSAARGRPLAEVFRIINALTRQVTENPAAKCLRENRIVGLENHTLLINKDGTERHIEDSAAPVRDRSGQVIGAVVVFYDASQTRTSPHLLSYQATHDALTGLVNRREFERRIMRVAESADAGANPHILMFMDLDQFKVVNDTFGHVAGDRLLRQLAQALAPHMGDHDTLARLGGDEFGMLFQSKEEARTRADDVLRVVNDFRFSWEGREFAVGASIGAVALTGSSRSPADLMSKADAACFVAKEKGRNRIQWYDEGDAMGKHRGQMGWVSRIQDALREGRFALWTQKVVPVAEGSDTPHHCEVLVRMVGEDGSAVLPSEFIPAAERYNLMPAIDRWVINEVLSLLGAHESPFSVGQCFVNLSAVSLVDPGMPGFIRAKLQEHGVQGSSLCFEVTETAVVTQMDLAIAFMHELKEVGCKFALDDFGSGMSSFRYLKDLPVDCLKIDGSFVSGMVSSPTDRAMVDAINRVAKAMGLATVAEYVEEPETLQLLREIGVDYAQGFAIHRPEPVRQSGQLT